jgi:uncharacterized protein
MIRISARFLGLLLLFITSFIANIAIAYDDKDFPKPSNPPRLVNDFAGMMSAAEQQQLESLLVSYDDSTSVQIAVVTLQSLGNYDISVYAPELFTRWGIGQKGKDNGVLILASASDRKIFISTGRGINAVITDARAGSIIRDIITPNFKQGRYFQGFYDASNAIIQLSKGEYKNDKKRPAQEGEGAIPVIVFLVIMFVIIFIIASGKGGGKGGGGGNYMSRRGSDFLTGAILGSILDRASRGSGGWGGGHGGGGFGGGGFGGFGGFGGGSTDGGGAGGSW